jgi:ubiquinone/menaquinone biosynthesis C-methylase UbiE
VSGVDLSLALVERSACRRQCVLGDARSLPIRTASRDVAIVQGGLHHLASLDDVRQALKEMRRVLKPDGRAIVIEPWPTPFLRIVHLIAERRLARALSTTLDAFAAMTDEERPTYEAWLASPGPILAALTARFEAILVRRRLGKLIFVGRPLPDSGAAV